MHRWTSSLDFERARAWLLLAALAAALLGTSCPSRAQAPAPDESQREQIFEKAFGKRPPRPTRPLQLPVLVDGTQIADTIASGLDDPARTRMQAASVLAALEKIIVPEPLAKLKAAVAPDGTLAFAAFRTVGMDARYDEQNSAVALIIPPDVRQVIRLGASTEVPPIGPRGVVPQVPFSSYLNIRGGMDYIHQSAIPGQAGRQPLNLALESATNYYGFVLLADLNYQESSQNPWQRGDVSLVYDDPAAAIRYQAGDLSYPIDAFQAFQPMAGITLARNFSLQPYKVYQPVGQEQFDLQSNSRVEVLVNGVRTQTYELGPGRYDIRQFPFTQGANNVQLRIVDAVGRISTINVPFFFSTDLLAAGEQLFNYSLGAPSTDVNGVRRYHGDMPTISAYHRYGVTDWLTVGANYQGDNRQQMGGGNVSISSPLGSVRLDLAGSHVADFGNGGSGRILYNYTDAPAPPLATSWSSLFQENRTVFASVTYTSKYFAALGTLVPDNTVVWDFEAGISQPLFFGITGGIGGGYQTGRDGQRDTSSVNLSLRRYFLDRISTDLELSRTVAATGAPNYRALFTVSVLFPSQRQSVQGSYDTQNHTSQLEWQYLPPFDTDEPFIDVAVTHSDSNTEVTGNLTYNTSRVETLFIHDEVLPTGTSNQSPLERRSSIRFGTAIAYAGGYFAVSRPINDAFAMVVPHPSLADYTVGVQPVGGHFAATAGLLGPAVVYNITSYQVQPVTVAASDLPLGYDLGPGIYQVSPGYRGGIVIPVGSDANVLLDGVLHDAMEKPIGLAHGFAKPADGKGEAKEFFTNRTGRFRIDGLRPAAYDLVFPDLGSATVRVEIPRDKAGVYRVGTIVISVPATR